MALHLIDGVFSTFSIIAATRLLRSSALRLPGRMAMCQFTPGLASGRLSDRWVPAAGWFYSVVVMAATGSRSIVV
jgi:hypothetical protein